MATVRLFNDELEEWELPPFCMRCGAPAALVKYKRFSWGPGWVVALLATGAIGSGPLFLFALILIPILLKRKGVAVPLCQRHRNHWLPLQVVLYGGLGVLAALFSTAVLLWALAEGPADPKR